MLPSCNVRRPASKQCVGMPCVAGTNEPCGPPHLVLLLARQAQAEKRGNDISLARRHLQVGGWRVPGQSQHIKERGIQRKSGARTCPALPSY